MRTHVNCCGGADAAAAVLLPAPPANIDCLMEGLRSGSAALGAAEGWRRGSTVAPASAAAGFPRALLDRPSI